ncbi:MAG: methionyl-tRNA formyltransferase [Patescibacteria group bacterium]|jgi:methionyl-tRNA formyltransferase
MTKNNLKQRIFFFGTPEFAVPALRALLQNDYNVVLVITQIDQLIGRKQILTPTAIKVEAKMLGLEVCENLKDLRLKIETLKPDLGIVVAYGKIIPQEILDLFPLGVLNIHPSLLPKYRGPSPIQSAILNGDKETGVSIIKLDEKMDHGSKLITQNLKLKADDNYQSLSERLAGLGAKLLVETLPDYLAGKIRLEPQNNTEATFCKIINKEDGKIDWQNSADQIERQIRAYAQWPGSYTELKSKNLKLKTAKIISAQAVESISNLIGQLQVDNGKLYIQCGHGALLIEKLQPEGKKEMTAKEFINGYLRD